MPRKINEVGNIYGRLQVIREATKEERGKLTGGCFWICRCTCGNEKMINGHSLRDGSTVSCGCYNKEVVSQNSKKKVIDEVGNRYGKLLVLKRDESTESKNVRWICQCDCGNKKSILADSLRDGLTSSCGCLRKEIAEKHMSKLSANNYVDEVGNKYGRLLVISKSNEHFESDLNGVYYNCICSCENHTKVRVRGIDLRNCHNKSCGCLHSSGESLITELLNKNKLSYIREYRFHDLYLISKQFPLRFDFGIIKNNNLSYLIEYQGRQHYEVSEYFGGNDKFERCIESDNAKIKYCKDNEIPLIVIPYTHFKNLCIDDLRLETTKFLVT